MLTQLRQISSFFRRLRVQARVGRLSRAPLRLLRLEWRGDIAECDWLARLPDEWDADLPSSLGERHVALQALEDAIAMRDLLFCTLPDLSRAVLRVYRQSASEARDLIITGTVDRDEQVPEDVRSLPMRAKLYGFRFLLEDGRLGALHLEKLQLSM